MSPRKKNNDDGEVAVISPRPARAKPNQRWLYVAPVIVLLSAGICYGVWQKVRPHVLADSQYLVQPDQLLLTQPPAWVKGDIRAEVLRDATRGGPLSLLDGDLTVRMASAFAAHPWVARVDRVSKHFPSGLEVVVTYRQPVAMVEVQDGQAVLAVDENSVVLPSRGFTPEDAEKYPRICEIRTTPAGNVGTRWGDACVLGGAQIAAVLANDWQSLDLIRIVPVERKPGRSGVEYTYALVTRSGTMVYWGRAPGTDTPGEVPAAEKVAQLKRYMAQNQGTLDGPDGPQQIEIDDRGALLRKSRPMVTPLPKADDLEETPPE